MDVHIRLNNLTKKYGDFLAVDNLNLNINKSEFVTLLGASGCGKSTTLRMLAGFIQPDEGEIYFENQYMNDILPEKRDVSMVFQSYALFPHKSVYDNVNFGLKMRNVPKEKQKDIVSEALSMVNLIGVEKRMPYELSGGQQQRVALARAMVIRPNLLLFDEPLSNLDAKLREKVRMEIKELQSKLGITTVYVTHDQEEALSISDKIVVMDKGRIIQVGSPEEIYKKPKNAYIANFIGRSNVLKVKLDSINDDISNVKTSIGDIKFKTENPSKEFQICIRPEDISILDKEGSGFNEFTGRVSEIVFLGKYKKITVVVNDTNIEIEVDKDKVVSNGDDVIFTIPQNKINVMEEE